MRTISWLGVLAGVFWTGIGSGAVLVTAPFTNSQHVAQHWFTGGPAAAAIVSNNALVFVSIPNGAPRGALTYLTDVDHPLHLQPGAELTLTFHYTFGQSDPSDWGLMFGFFDSAGKQMVKREGAYNDSIFATYRGYIGTGVFGEAKPKRFRIARRKNGSVNNLLSPMAYERLGELTQQTGGRLPGQTYAASLKLVCPAPGQLTVTATIDGQTIHESDLTAVTDFDTVAIFSTRQTLQFVIRNVIVNYEPDAGGKKAAAPTRVRP